MLQAVERVGAALAVPLLESSHTQELRRRRSIAMPARPLGNLIQRWFFSAGLRDATSLWLLSSIIRRGRLRLNDKSALSIPEPIVQLQRQLDQFRSAQPHRAKIPEGMWQAAVELAQQHGLYAVAHPLRLDYMGLKRRLAGPRRLRKEEAGFAGIRGIDCRHIQRHAECLIEFECKSWRQDAHSVEGIGCAGLDKSVSRLAGSGTMIHITAQMRVLVAIEAVDGRKGSILWFGFVRRSSLRIRFRGCVFVFRSRRGTSIRLLSYDGQGYWLAQKRLSKGRFRWWPESSSPAKALEAYEAQLLMVAGDVSRVRAAPMWRRVNAGAVRWQKHIFPLRSKKNWFMLLLNEPSFDIAGGRSARKTSYIYAR